MEVTIYRGSNYMLKGIILIKTFMYWQKQNIFHNSFFRVPQKTKSWQNDDISFKFWVNYPFKVLSHHHKLQCRVWVLVSKQMAFCFCYLSSCHAVWPQDRVWGGKTLSPPWLGCEWIHVFTAGFTTVLPSCGQLCCRLSVLSLFIQ